jgi:hypothetical protein
MNFFNFRKKIEMLSHFNFKSFSSHAAFKLNPWFVTGFSDAESCFFISAFGLQKDLIVE